MKIDFSQILKTRKGEPIPQVGIAEVILSTAVRLRKETDKINSLFDAGIILDRERITISEILALQGEPLTLREVCCTALESGVQGEQLTAKEKRTLLHMSEKIWGAKEPVEILDTDKLIERIAKVFVGNLVPGQAYDMLNPEEPEK